MRNKKQNNRLSLKIKNLLVNQSIKPQKIKPNSEEGDKERKAP